MDADKRSCSIPRVIARSDTSSMLLVASIGGNERDERDEDGQGERKPTTLCPHNTACIVLSNLPQGRPPRGVPNPNEKDTRHDTSQIHHLPSSSRLVSDPIQGVSHAPTLIIRMVFRTYQTSSLTFRAPSCSTVVPFTPVSFSCNPQRNIGHYVMHPPLTNSNFRRRFLPLIPDDWCFHLDWP